MLSFLIVLLILVAIGYRVTTAQERAHLSAYVHAVVMRVQQWSSGVAPFRASLRERTPWVLSTPALVAVNGVFVVLVLLDGATNSESTVLAWGGAQGTLTGDGEWWRLVTATFLHDSVLQFVVVSVCLVQVGVLAERLIGPITLICTYVAAGAFGNAVCMSNDVTSTHAGGASAVFGLYGVLVAISAWGLLRRGAIVIPLTEYKLLAPGVTCLLLSTLAISGANGRHTLAGLTVGAIIGLAGAMKATTDTKTRPAIGAVSFATAVALLAIVYAAIPVRSLTSVRQQLAELVALEDGTAEIYRKVLRRFTDRRTPPDANALTGLINEEILPQLSRAAADIAALEHLPEQRPLVENALAYLRLRETSWRLRAEGLRKRNIRLLQEADSAEQESLQALKPLKNLRSEGPQRRPVNFGAAIRSEAGAAPC